MIAVDLDGTLLNDSLALTDLNKAAICNLLDKGIHVVFSTGRTYQAAKQYAEEFVYDMPLITYNGALIKRTYSEEILFSKKIAYSNTKEILRIGEANSIYTKMYIDDVLYVKEESEQTIKFVKNHKINYKVVGKLSENIHKEPYMIVFIDHENRIKTIRAEIDKYTVLPYTLSTPYSLEFLPDGISKGEGLRRVAKSLKIRKKEILAIGNSLNDLDMLRWAGIGVAMNNSDIELKEHWNLISKYNNNENGVAKIIQEYCRYHK
nr:Cof-type HAD-IIB family hydrolase [Alkalibaculum sporogenes]